jgi:hypothetical protein
MIKHKTVLGVNSIQFGIDSLDSLNSLDSLESLDLLHSVDLVDLVESVESFKTVDSNASVDLAQICSRISIRLSLPSIYMGTI